MAPSAAPPAPVKQTSGANSEKPTVYKRVEDEEVKPYVIVSDLGKGSFATVYRGYHEVSCEVGVHLATVYG